MDSFVDASGFAAVDLSWDADQDGDGPPLVSAIIPCLNEERTLGICIRKALELINTHYGKDLTLATVPAEDPGVYDML